MRILKTIIELIRNFFTSKTGKRTAKVAGGTGIGAAIFGIFEMLSSHRKNKRAESIKTNAIERLNKGYADIEPTLASLGQKKLEVYKSIGLLADAIEKIQQRPTYELSINGIELPAFEPTEFKKMANGIEIAIGGVGGIAAGGAVGVAIMGTGTILALAPGALFGGVAVCAMGAKMLKRSAENLEQAKKIEKDVDRILVYYTELDKTAQKFRDTFSTVEKSYSKRLEKAQKITTRKDNWERFSNAERLEIENAILLAQLLCHMCAVNLKTDAITDDEVDKVNTAEVDRVIADAKNICEQVKNRSVRKGTIPISV